MQTTINLSEDKKLAQVPTELLTNILSKVTGIIHVSGEGRPMNEILSERLHSIATELSHNKKSTLHKPVSVAKEEIDILFFHAELLEQLKG